MTKPKTLEQLRAEKERAETRLAQEQHKLERLENRKKYLEQGVQAAISTETEKITQPSGAATPRNSDAHKRIAVPKAFCVLWEHPPSQDPKAAKFAVLPPGHAGLPKCVKQSDGSNSAPSETARVSPCKPLCAIFLREPSVYPLSPAKANVGHLCEKLKIGMRSGWGQRCGGNFLAIVAGTILGEKPNFLSQILDSEGRSILAQIKRGAPNWAPLSLKAPQCGAFRGFETAV